MQTTVLASRLFYNCRLRRQ